MMQQIFKINFQFTDQSDGNLAFHVGDAKSNVIANHKNLAQKLKYPLEKLVHMKQIHSNIVKTVDANDNFENPPTCDALITDSLNTPLMVMVADCSPIIFYDAIKKVIAVAHAGRAGAFFNIVHNVIESFVDNFDSNSSDIIVEIGASIKECCYEVGEEIVEEAKSLNLAYSITKREDSYYLDISTILYNQLLASGVKKENIKISDECSCCKSKKYFSYRAEKETGRFAGVIFMQ